MIIEETDPNGMPPSQPGAKLDAGKVKFRRAVIEQFPHALLEVAKLTEWGATKYTWDGWKAVPDGIKRYADAQDRHAIKAVIEGPFDEDSGLLHATHEAWNALAKLELMLMEGK